MTQILSAVGACLMLAGSFFILTAALGLLRFPDLYTRMHAASKAGAAGAGLVLLGAGISTGDPAAIVRCFAGLAFLLLTTPVSAHLLAKAAHHRGQALYPLGSPDALAKDVAKAAGGRDAG